MKSSFGLTAFVLLSFPICADLPECKKVGLADVGWTDVSATTALAAELLKALKYEPEIRVLSLPLALKNLKNKNLDVFLGNWMPTQESYLRPYLADKSIVSFHKNLKEARFSLAVPSYVYDAGVRSFKDLNGFHSQFGGKIYGVEPGNDGNDKIIYLLKNNIFGLHNWEIFESSEQGMLLEVKEAIRQKKWIVFLAWSPHPMNSSLDIKYLEGGDDYFGKNLGQAQVYTLARKNFKEDCPNIAHLFHNLSFTPNIENTLMTLILDEHLSPQKAAKIWLSKNQKQARSWLLGINDITGQEANIVLSTYINELEHEKSKKKILQLPLGRFMEQGIYALTARGAVHLRIFSDAVEKVISFLLEFFEKVPWPLLLSALSLLSYAWRRSLALSLMTFFGLLLIVNLQLWHETLETLVLVIFSSLISLLLGIPLGIIAARCSKFYAVLKPVLDLLHAIPIFVFLIPTLMLFGLGLVPGIISTIFFAIGAPIRLTYLGLTTLPRELIEASEAFGATKWQRFFKVELTYARSFIVEGFAISIMLSLSMVIIAALVGVPGLGIPLIRSLSTVDIAPGFEAGIAIVILAILLNRTLNFDKFSWRF